MQLQSSRMRSMCAHIGEALLARGCVFTVCDRYPCHTASEEQCTRGDGPAHQQALCGSVFQAS